MCPYDDLGCFFRHETSRWCKFQNITKQIVSIQAQITCTKCESSFENKDDLIIHEHEDHIDST